MLNSVRASNLQHLVGALDAHLETTYAPGAPGAALLVSLAGEVLYERGIGIANLTTGEPITEDTTFRLASVSKQFTAMGIQLLEQQGRLSYEDTLQQFFSGFAPGIWEQVKLSHLLCHTSGLHDYEDFVEERDGWQISDEEVLGIAAAQSATYFVPGSRYRYSNTGYVLLALVVEKVSGIPYADFLQQHIFEPLGMVHTVLYEKGKHIPNRAMGYAKDASGHFVLADQGTCTATKGDGCLYTSVRDYLRWHQAINNKEGMAPTLDRIGFPLENYPDAGYGMGWFYAKRRTGGLEMYHTGNTSGFSNLAIRIPENDVLVVCLSNRADNPFLLTSLLDVLNEFPELRLESELVRDLLELTR